MTRSESKVLTLGNNKKESQGQVFWPSQCVSN